MFNIRVNFDIELRLHEEQYAQQYYAIIDRNRLHLRQWLPWVSETYNLEDTKMYIQATLEQFTQNQGFHCGIWYQDTLIGSIGYHNLDWVNRKVEIGYWLDESQQGKGIITRSSSAFVSYAFEQLHLNKVEIRCAIGNERSCAVAQRLGFIKEGVIRDEEWLHDHFVDREVYGMLSSEWKRSHTFS